MRKALFIYFGILIVATLLIVAFLIQNNQTLQNIPSVAKEIREVNLPGPLTSLQNIPSAHLTRSGVIEWTNIMRQREGLPLLLENGLLNQSAQNKLDDMFANQYFAHDSPNGVVLADLVVGAGYEYLTIGENLALGNYANDQAVVQGWMDSPGHRENILKNSYEEIGVAVGQQMYEGRMTWLAVQHFGRPLSSCSSPDANLKTEIDHKISQSEEMKADLEARRQELEQSNPQAQEEKEAHNRKVDEYNAKVNEYNALIAQVKDLINIYNAQIASFNSCTIG